MSNSISGTTSRSAHAIVDALLAGLPIPPPLKVAKQSAGVARALVEQTPSKSTTSAAVLPEPTVPPAATTHKGTQAPPSLASLPSIQFGGATATAVRQVEAQTASTPPPTGNPAAFISEMQRNQQAGEQAAKRIAEQPQASAATPPAGNASEGSTRKKQVASGPTSKIDKESRELLTYISQDFVQYVGGKQECALHIESGDMITRPGLKTYCAKHYGDVLFIDSEGKEERVSAGDTWWTWNDPEKRVVRRVVMEPTMKSEADDNPEVFNLWHMRKKEMVEPNMSATLDDVQILLDHLMYISDGDQVGVLYFLNWLAQLYQTPGVKIPTAILMYSEYGRVGKSSLHKLISRVFGPSMTGSCTGHQIQKQFNDVVEYKRLVFVNEMPKSEKADHYEQFKNAVSEEFVQFEGKGRASKEIRNIAHYIVTTNHTQALPLMKNDGRICVLMCTSQRKPDEYYQKLIPWMENEGPSLLAGVLAQWKFPAEWDPHAPVPQTEAAQALQQASRSVLEMTIEDLMAEGRAPFDLELRPYMDIAIQLQNLYGDNLLRGVCINNNKTLPTALQAAGAVQLNPKSKRPSDKPWCWRRVEFWKSKSPKERRDYMQAGVSMTLVKNGEVCSHE